MEPELNRLNYETKIPNFRVGPKITIKSRPGRGFYKMSLEGTAADSADHSCRFNFGDSDMYELLIIYY